jgi:uncharacterized membrane protein
MATRGIDRTDLGEGASHEGFLRHKNRRWLKIASLISVLSLIVYATVDVQPRHNGGSWYGYLLGTVGALMILWLTLLGIRKRAMTRGRWSLKAWTSAHVYLGLSLIVIGTLHAGFQFGWNVHTLAYALMMLVIIPHLRHHRLFHVAQRAQRQSRGDDQGSDGRCGLQDRPSAPARRPAAAGRRHRIGGRLDRPEIRSKPASSSTFRSLPEVPEPIGVDGDAPPPRHRDGRAGRCDRDRVNLLERKAARSAASASI